MLAWFRLVCFARTCGPLHAHQSFNIFINLLFVEFTQLICLSAAPSHLHVEELSNQTTVLSLRQRRRRSSCHR